MYSTEPHWWSVNIGSANGWLPSGNYLRLILTQISDHMASRGHNERTHWGLVTPYGASSTVQPDHVKTASYIWTGQIIKTRVAFTPKYPRPPRSVYCETVYVMILFNFSSRVPIPHWLCILHVHWSRDCETVPEQHWNKPGTVSQSQCKPPQFKQIFFGIKNESKVQGQSSSEFTGILTVLKCICGPNLEILTWICDE